MKFFLPGVADVQKAEEFYQAIRQFAHQQSGWEIKETRIYSVEYLHEGKYYTDTVGEANARNGEIVSAILASNSYLVCTTNRGVLRGEPIMIGRPDKVIRFDP